MKTNRRAAAVFFAVLVLCFVQLYIEGQELPERVATHYDQSGRPDGWTGRNTVLIIFAVIHGITALAFFVMGRLAPRIPPAYLNLPNRDYWLAPERREATCARLFGGMLWLGAATLGFFGLIFHNIVRSNVEPRGDAQIGWFFWASLGLFAVFVLGWGVHFYRAFRKPEME
jgi:hypothetical protein